MTFCRNVKSRCNQSPLKIEYIYSFYVCLSSTCCNVIKNLTVLKLSTFIKKRKIKEYVIRLMNRNQRRRTMLHRLMYASLTAYQSVIVMQTK